MSLDHADIEGKYEILEKIREGGMGAIYKVRHRLLDDVRVIKVIRPQFAGQEELDQRFRREARTAIRLRHPNIAQIFDFSVAEDSTAFIVMEFIDGLTFQEMIAAGGPPELSLTLEVARQGLRALSYLHQRGYVHRDVSSDNLMLTRDFDGSPLVKLIDLGIVKRLTGEAGLTATGTFMGKARYSAPEHFSGGGGSAKVDARSDLYSYGVLLYELLTGQFPVVGTDFSEMIAGHLFRPPRPFGETDPDGRVPAGLRELVLLALEKDPAKRIASADELAERMVPFQELKKESLVEALNGVLESSVPAAGKSAASSSTRRRLEGVFAKRTTPPPAPLASIPEQGDPSRIERRRIASLLDDARLLAQLEQRETARNKVLEVLALDPENTEAQRFLASLEAVSSKGRRKAPAKVPAPKHAAPKQSAPKPGPTQPPPEKPESRPALAAAATIEADLEAGRVAQAREELALALKLYGPDPALEALEARLRKLEEPLPETAVPMEEPRRRKPWATKPFQLAAAALAAAVLLGVLLLGRGGKPRPGSEAAPPTAPAEEVAAAGGPATEEEAPAEDSATLAAGSQPEPPPEPLASEPASPPPAVVAKGTLILDALPWGRVRSITASNGSKVSLPSDAYTPLRLQLPAGSYSVELADRKGTRKDLIRIEVRSEAVTERQIDLGRPDAEAYFRNRGFTVGARRSALPLDDRSRAG
ncbi:MAG: protein kinase [Acidobacteria bacterium]|nr:protein kinase [Acidobacteriota bacterium]